MTTTPEPTPEQAAAHALNTLWRGETHDGNDWLPISHEARTIAETFRAAGLLVGDPTEDAVERAARSLHDRQWRKSSTHPKWGELGHCLSESGHRSEVMDDARAALAAAGVAPQEPTSERCAECGDKLDYVAGLDGEGCYPHCWRCWYKDHPVDYLDLRTLDEAALAEAVEDARRRWDGSGRHEPISAAITRAVLEVLRGGR